LERNAEFIPPVCRQAGNPSDIANQIALLIFAKGEMKMKTKYVLSMLVLLALLFATGIASARPLTAALSTGFTYQGKLTDGGSPANGTYDFEFKLYDALSAGNPVGGTVTQSGVTVTAGLFTVQLDFGNVFDGTALWLDIGVRPVGGSGYTALTPRQALTATPFANYAAKAPWLGLTGVPSGFADGTDNNTTYTAGTGLTLAGSQFSVNTTVIQARVSSTCTAGNAIRVINANGTVTCESVTGGAGDITGVTAGTGLTGGGANGDVTLTANTTYLQRRVSGTCVAGSSISTVNADGTVSCETDDNTTYTAGTGLSLAGTQFSVTGAPWSGLTGVPSGFADGTDNNTTYTAGDGLVLAGTQFSGKGTSYQNVVIVAQSGGDFTTITAALDSITDASASNPYLIYVAPGVYIERVTMKQYVDIEGAGELTTKITYTGSVTDTTGTVLGANDAELRFLMVENTGGAAYAVAIYNSSASPRLTHVTASASGGMLNHGVYNNSSSPTMTDVSASASGGTYNYGVYNNSSSPTMTDVSASASGGTSNYGVDNYSSSPTMTDVTASASGGTDYNLGVFNYWGASPTMTNVSASASGGISSYGVYNYTSSPTINNSNISASGGINNYGIYNFATSGFYTALVNNSQVSGTTDTIYNDPNFTTRVGASQLSGGAVAGAGTLTCAGVYDEVYAFYASTCP